MTKTSSIENIFNEYKTNYKDGPSFTIDFYKNNSIILDNITTFQTSEELRIFIELTWQYLNAKYSKGHYSDVIDIVSKKRSLLDSEIIRLDNSNLKDDWYYGIIFISGMSNYSLKKYKKAISIFQELVNYDSKSDRFKDWLNHSIYGQRSWLTRTVLFTSLIFIGAQILLDIFYKHFAFNGALLDIGMLGLVSSALYEFFMRYKFRITTGKR